MKKKYLILLVIILIFISAKHSIAYSSDTIYVKNFLLQNDTKISGVLSKYSMFFNVDEQWIVEKGSYIELIFSQSQIKEYKGSTLTVSLNNIPIYSTTLFDKQVYKKNIKIPLSISQIKNYNEIKIEAYHRITDDPCTDYINPANWILLHKESYVHVKYRYRNDTISLKEFPYPYIKSSADNPIDFAYLLDNNQSDIELDGIMLASAYFGREQKNVNINQQCIKINETDKLKNTNIIYIGSYIDMPSSMLDLLNSDEKKIIKNKGLIKEVISPFNKEKRLLLILSDNKEILSSSIRSLFNDEIKVQMKKATQVIDENIIIKDLNTSNKDYLTLEDLQYNSFFVNGLFNQEVKYDINIPKNWIVSEDAKLALQLRYSDALDFDSSLVTVYINDIPIGSKKLSVDRVNNDLIELEIPKDIKYTTYYEIRIVFYLETIRKDCDYRLGESSWVYLSNKSYFYLPHKEKEYYYFDYYTGPFVKNKILEDVVIVLGDNPNQGEFNTAINTLGFIGQSTEIINEVKVVKGNEFETLDNKKQNIIIVGTPNNNSFVRSINSKLHVRFDSAYKKYISNDKISFLEGVDLSILQMIKSPYEKTKYLMLISSTIEEGLDWCTVYLSDYEFVTKLKGDVVTIDEDGNINTLYYNQYNKEEILILSDKENIQQEVSEPRIMQSDVKRLILYSIVILVLIFTSIYLIIRKKNKF